MKKSKHVVKVMCIPWGIIYPKKVNFLKNYNDSEFLQLIDQEINHTDDSWVPLAIADNELPNVFISVCYTHTKK